MTEKNPTVETTANTIDVKQAIYNKNPRILKFMPGFVLRYLQRILHEKDINEFIKRYGKHYGLDFVDKIIEHFQIKVQVAGLSNIPKDGRYLFAANHPLGGIDGIAFMQVVSKIDKNIAFPVNDFLLYLTNLKELFIPINKHGSNIQNARIIEETFASEKTLLYFPAGLCSRKQKREIIDLEWKKSFVTKAKRHGRSIVPVYILGKNSNFFYNLANFRKFLGVKFNIEMLYLVNEVYKQKNKNILLVFGKPISVETLKSYKSDKAAAEAIKKITYNLITDLKPEDIVNVN